MELIPSEYEKVIILGNGFDLNLGMKTSYCDFIKSDYFKTIIKNNNPYAQALMSKLKDENTRWIDAENELKNIANNNIQLKSIHFKELCNSLLNYISEIKVP